MNTLTRFCFGLYLCSVAVALVFDLFGANYTSRRIYFNNSEEYTHFHCGVCATGYGYCCPINLIGCNQSTMRCSSHKFVTECGHSRQCLQNLTYDDIAAAIAMVPLFLFCMFVSCTEACNHRNSESVGDSYVRFSS